MSQPLSFDFIIDEDLRASLVADYMELQTCLSTGAWKAAHVMSGSIVEALLVDYLLGIQHSKKDPLKMTMEELIDAGRTSGVLSQKTSDLSSVIRGYRNMIHPGRLVRLGETVDEEGARIADALVSLIVREVAAKQAQVYGLTAEQLLTKFEGDPSALAISDHLLRDSKQHELERLMVNVLPERYFFLSESDAFEEDTSEAMARLARLYVDAYKTASEPVQKKVAKRYVAVLREEAGWRVTTYDERFFRGYFLAHLSDGERKLVKDHFFSRTAEGQVPALLDPSEGLSAYLRANEVNRFLDPIVRIVSYSRSPELRAAAATRVEAEYRDDTPEQLQPRFVTRLEEWTNFHVKGDRPEAAERTRAIWLQLGGDDDIPF
jgi:hypothetical protein